MDHKLWRSQASDKISGRRKINCFNCYLIIGFIISVEIFHSIHIWWYSFPSLNTVVRFITQYFCRTVNTRLTSKTFNSLSNFSLKTVKSSSIVSFDTYSKSHTDIISVIWNQFCMYMYIIYSICWLSTNRSSDIYLPSYLVFIIDELWKTDHK